MADRDFDPAFWELQRMKETYPPYPGEVSEADRLKQALLPLVFIAPERTPDFMKMILGAREKQRSMEEAQRVWEREEEATQYERQQQQRALLLKVYPYLQQLPRDQAQELARQLVPGMDIQIPEQPRYPREIPALNLDKRMRQLEEQLRQPDLSPVVRQQVYRELLGVQEQVRAKQASEREAARRRKLTPLERVAERAKILGMLQKLPLKVATPFYKELKVEVPEEVQPDLLERATERAKVLDILRGLPSDEAAPFYGELEVEPPEEVQPTPMPLSDAGPEEWYSWALQEYRRTGEPTFLNLARDIGRARTRAEAERKAREARATLARERHKYRLEEIRTRRRQPLDPEVIQQLMQKFESSMAR